MRVVVVVVVVVVETKVVSCRSAAVDGTHTYHYHTGCGAFICDGFRMRERKRDHQRVAGTNDQTAAIQQPPKRTTNQTSTTTTDQYANSQRH